jgi:hypothetical protein
MLAAEINGLGRHTHRSPRRWHLDSQLACLDRPGLACSPPIAHRSRRCRPGHVCTLPTPRNRSLFATSVASPSVDDGTGIRSSAEGIAPRRRHTTRSRSNQDWVAPPSQVGYLKMDNRRFCYRSLWGLILLRGAANGRFALGAR